MTYRDYILGWAQAERAKTPKLGELYDTFCAEARDSSLKPHALYELGRTAHRLAKKLFSSYRSGAAPNDDNELFYLVPTVRRDGSVVYHNLAGNRDMRRQIYGNNQLRMTRQPNGLFSIAGRKHLIEMVGGRGLMSDLLNKLADGDFHHDVGHKGYRKAA